MNDLVLSQGFVSGKDYLTIADNDALNKEKSRVDCSNATNKGVNMTDLVRIEKLGFGSEEVNSVNARDVWEFVESKSQFADWIKDRLEGFQESVDFEGFKKIMKNDLGINVGRRIEYALTLDTAKHICMLERNEKGRQLRQYFIDCEKRLLAQPPQRTPQQILETMNSEQLFLFASVKAEDERKILQLSGERDHAIKTKAQIADRKTATAMGTASAQKRRADKLERDLNLLKEKTGNVSKEITEAILESFLNDTRTRKDLEA